MNVIEFTFGVIKSKKINLQIPDTSVKPDQHTTHNTQVNVAQEDLGLQRRDGEESKFVP